MNRTWGTPIATLLAVTACLQSNAAYACSYSPIQFRAASELVPVSGPIVIEIVCQETDFCATGSVDTVTVTGPGGAVPGTFERVRGGEPVAFLVWRPAIALEAGALYAVRIGAQALLAQDGPDGPLPLEVHGDEASRWAQWEDPTWRFESVSEDTGEPFCCFAAQACFDHCFKGCHVFPARPLDALASYGPLGLIALAWRRRGAGRARPRAPRRLTSTGRS